ncbi:MAG: alanine-glyoxylate transaminase/serine-glyoxylate transaminase/serine-pyruvate transaminase [Verrucomicrobiales bacterium]|jgi:alanine-glyoxylate transaminase/serine-glyoxylate transaminase/serine-pyruvate transaminase
MGMRLIDFMCIVQGGEVRVGVKTVARNAEGRLCIAYMTAPLHPSERILMGPGPSPVPIRVLQALAAPTLGHLDPEYLAIMDETRDLLRQVFKTKNDLTMAVSGTGSAGMEAVVVNLVEPGDETIVCVNGVFGGRMKDVMERARATVHAVEVPWGQTFTPEMIAEALAKHPKAKMLGIVHAETSTGAHQPLEEISKLVHDAGMLFAVDCVTSLGGLPLEVDAWGIDAAYSGTQKCLSCPPGLSPVTFSSLAVEKMNQRQTKVQSWYLDMSMLSSYWSEERVYHHTAPINMTYALREALKIVMEEGLEARIARHKSSHDRLRKGLEGMGLSYVPENSLTTLNAIHVPDGADEAGVRKALLTEYGIEIGAGLGPFKGKAWRIGLMGHGSTVRNVDLVLTALKELLP